jgi:two-component system response regulator AtoC
VIAATNRNLERAVIEGTFREDLFYRLNVVTVHLPALRERLESIPLLVEGFLHKYGEQYHKDVKPLAPETLSAFMAYHWPGNVRELENLVKRMVVLANEKAIVQELRLREAPVVRRDEAQTAGVDFESLGVDLSGGRDVDLKAIAKQAAQRAEKRVIEKVLQQTRWNRKEAAERLQISYKALLYKMKDAGLSDRD